MASFISGQTYNTTIISWTGEEGNRTSEESLHSLYDARLNNINFDNSSGDIHLRYKVPEGFCKVHIGIQNANYFQISIYDDGLTGNEYNAYIFDPEASNPFQVPYSLDGDLINLKVTLFNCNHLN